MAGDVIWTEEASEDLVQVSAYIEADSVIHAARFVQSVVAAAESLSQFPLRGRIVPEDKLGEFREIFVGKYRLIYRVSDQDVIISALIHGVRQI